MIRRPRSYSGRVTYEGELGIVVGTTCKDASAKEAEHCIFGWGSHGNKCLRCRTLALLERPRFRSTYFRGDPYTCANDVTAADILHKDPNFPQWVRAKSLDGFGAFGPVAASGLDPSTLKVRTILNGQERQAYPISDMIFLAATLVGLLSRDMTLMPGDIICCGTSIGVGSMKDPTNVIEVEIEGIGALRNRFVND